MVNLERHAIHNTEVGFLTDLVLSLLLESPESPIAKVAHLGQLSVTEGSFAEAIALFVKIADGAICLVDDSQSHILCFVLLHLLLAKHARPSGGRRARPAGISGVDGMRDCRRQPRISFAVQIPLCFDIPFHAQNVHRQDVRAPLCSQFVCRARKLDKRKFISPRNSSGGGDFLRRTHQNCSSKFPGIYQG